MKAQFTGGWYASCLAALHELEKQGMFSREDIEFLRDLSFNHKCRDDSPIKMLAALIPIFTVLVVKERLTT